MASHPNDITATTAIQWMLQRNGNIFYLCENELLQTEVTLISKSASNVFHSSLEYPYDWPAPEHLLLLIDGEGKENKSERTSEDVRGFNTKLLLNHLVKKASKLLIQLGTISICNRNYYNMSCLWQLPLLLMLCVWCRCQQFSALVKFPLTFEKTMCL